MKGSWRANRNDKNPFILRNILRNNDITVHEHNNIIVFMIHILSEIGTGSSFQLTFLNTVLLPTATRFVFCKTFPEIIATILSDVASWGKKYVLLGVGFVRMSLRAFLGYEYFDFVLSWIILSLNYFGSVTFYLGIPFEGRVYCYWYYHLL